MALILTEAKEGSAYEEVLTFVPADHTFGIVGSFNEWGATPDIAMEADGENTWKGEVELAEGDEFKVRADNAWNPGADWGDAEGANFKCEAAGTYVVTITFEGGNGTVTVEPKA